MASVKHFIHTLLKCLLAGNVLAVTAACIIASAYADCNISQPAFKVLTVYSCRLIDPHKERKIMEFADKYPKGFVESAREQFVKEAQGIVESYRGAVIEETGEAGWINKYFYATKDADICTKFPKGSSMEVWVASACCDGDSNPPCYLGFSDYIMKELPIKRQTEAEAKDELMRMLSGTIEVQQNREEGHPELEQANGKPLSAFVSMTGAQEIFIPYASKDISDEDIKNILGKAIIVNYEELPPLHLLPCKYIKITDTAQRNFDLCVFPVDDLRGTITLPDQQKFWFAVVNEPRR